MNDAHENNCVAAENWTEDEWVNRPNRVHLPAAAPDATVEGASAEQKERVRSLDVLLRRRSLVDHIVDQQRSHDSIGSFLLNESVQHGIE